MVLKKSLIIGLNLIVFLSMAQKHTHTSQNTSTDTSTKKIITIKGIIEKGIEAGCIVMKTKENKVYLLLNLKTSVNIGSCIKAKGYIQTNTSTICMQGIPFYVVNYCPCNKKSKPKYQSDKPKEKLYKE